MHGTAGNAHRARAGLTLIELMTAITVLVVGVAALASTMVAGAAVDQVARETQVARRAIQTTIDTLRSAPFATVFATYNTSPADDPGGVGTAPGASFAVRGLTPLAGAPGGVAGQILFPSPGPTLLENAVDATLGMPRDLSLDGVVDGNNHASDYMILPVRVRVSWMGKSGPHTVEIQTQLSGI